MEIKEGYIKDFISGIEVKAGPEEVEAVQVFSRILVEDYNYDKSMIRTHPQWRVKSCPSDLDGRYPVDIAVFNSNNHCNDELKIIVECKKKTRKDGKDQLEDYLRLSKANIGVWFNGEEKLCIKKIESNGEVKFKEIPNIPVNGQRVEDVGLYKKKDLIPATNLKSIFKTIRNFLAANVVGATRDEVLAQQIINIIFCKIYDERYTKPDEMVSFRIGENEDPKIAKKRILNLFDLVKKQYNDVIDAEDKIMLDENSLFHVVGELQMYSLMNASRDAIGDAFEVFIDHALKGGQGQFFTPRNVINMIVEMLEPNKNDYIIDPSCGSGGFLIESLRYVWNSIEIQGKELGWSENEIGIEKRDAAQKCFRGIDKDYFLSKVCKAYMAVMGDGRGGIFCNNSLENPNNWSNLCKEKINFGKFSLIMTNPPFGSKIKVEGDEILSQYDLACKWKFNKKNNEWEKGKLNKSESPQYLFIERYKHLLKAGGRLGVVLPDGVLGNDKLGYIRSFIKNNFKILAIIDIPKETFMPHTSTKTSVILLQKVDEPIKDDYPIFMAVCEKCGHDRRGNIIKEDDLPEVAKEFKRWRSENGITF